MNRKALQQAASSADVGRRYLVAELNGKVDAGHVAVQRREEPAVAGPGLQTRVADTHEQIEPRSQVVARGLHQHIRRAPRELERGEIVAATARLRAKIAQGLAPAIRRR